MNGSLLAFMLLFATPLAAATEPFYIGTYTEHSDSQGIYLGALDAQAGTLSALTIAAREVNPNFLALSPNEKFLYAALGHDQVGAFAREPDGTLRLLNRQPAGGGEPVHVVVDATDRNLLVANYGGGSIACFRIKDDGSLGARSAFVQFTGSGPNKARQDKPHAHSIYIDPDNAHVYSCDLGTDQIRIFKFDAATGTLTPANPPSAHTEPGSGPRHLAFSRDGRFVYVVTEMGCTVDLFARNKTTGGLRHIETVSAVPPGTSLKGLTVAEVVVHPTGQWLYVSCRGIDTISVFAIAADGRLMLKQSVSAGVEMPRHFALDPTGDWLLSAGQKDSRLALLKIDRTDGHLSAPEQTAKVGSPVDVDFVQP